jgi:hypothetical protein
MGSKFCGRIIACKARLAPNSTTACKFRTLRSTASRCHRARREQQTAPTDSPLQVEHGGVLPYALSPPTFAL